MSDVTRSYTFTGLAGTRCQVSAQRFTTLVSNYRTPDHGPNTPQPCHTISQPQLRRPGGGLSPANMPEERRHLGFLRISPSSFHDTWSKAFHSKKSSKSQPTESDKPTDQELHARVAAIKSVLEDIEPGINAINNLIQIFRENGHYCDCCSPEKRKAGSCGSSCALLRPKGGDLGITVVTHGGWEKRAAMTKGQYLCIAREIRKAGDTLKANKVSRWELDVADMQQGLTSRLEKAWKEGLMSKEIKEVAGLDLEWTFDQAWREKEAEVGLAPVELPH